MPTCLVTLTVKNSTGAAVPNASFAFTPAKPMELRATDGAVIVGGPVEVVCSVGGTGSVNLTPGPYTYRTSSAFGEVIGTITVPDLVTIGLDVLIGTVEAPYAQISWAEYQTLVSVTASPAASVTAGLAAVVDGTVYLALSDDGVSIIQRVAGAAVPCFVEI